MCGISGIINKSEYDGLDLINKMNALIAHRGPDSEGVYKDNNVILGHRRLSIIDTSQKASQPMEFWDKYVIVFNGEIYNYKELRNTYLVGYKFNTNSDTEVVLAAYDKWGFDCVNYFRGMWSFIIYDKLRSIAFCSRDRFGIKPFYYYPRGDIFAIASEIKQFTILPGWKAVANKDRILDFLVFEMMDHTNETLFKGVYQLKAGCNLIYDLKSHEFHVQRYYDIADLNENKLSFDAAKNELADKVAASVREHLVADVKVGSCLSGGLDSSTIVCIAQEILKSEKKQDMQEVVSSCFENKKYDEQVYIDEVARSKNIIAHKVFPKFENLFNELDNLIWHQDEPFGSTSIFAQWCVFAKAKEKGIKVMLDGQGADEQLAGYPGFYDIYLNELSSNFKIERWINENKALKRFYGYSNKMLLKSNVKFKIPNSIKSILKSKSNCFGYDWVVANKGYFKRYMDFMYSANNKDIRSYSITQLKYTSLPRLLHYEDRDSMAHSIESRVPFLDHRLVEFVLSLPSEFKIWNGITKYALRKSMENIVPGEILGRKDKMGFVTPEEVWIRENKELFRNKFESSCEKMYNIIDKYKALIWFDDLVNSNGKIDFTIWRVICLGRWFEIFNVQKEV